MKIHSGMMSSGQRAYCQPRTKKLPLVKTHLFRLEDTGSMIYTIARDPGCMCKLLKSHTPCLLKTEDFDFGSQEKFTEECVSKQSTP